MFWEILKQVSFYAVSAGLLTFLIQSLAKHFLSKDIETFKAKLQAASTEQEIRYRRLDAKFDEHLVEICRRLFRFYDRVKAYVDDLGPAGPPFGGEKQKAASAAREDFWDYFLDSRIYVPPALYDKIRPLAVKLNRIAAAHARNEEAERKDVERDEAQLHEPERMLREEATPEFKAIEADVQRILGVITDKPGTG